MAPESKHKMDEFFNWVMRVAGGIIIWQLTSLQSNVQDLVGEKKALTHRVIKVESELRDVRMELNDIFKNYDLKKKH